MRKAIFTVAIGAALFLGSMVQAAATAQQKCQAAKNAAAGKYAACRQNAEKGLALHGDNDKYDAAITKCEGKFADAWQKASLKATEANATCPDAPLTDANFKTVIDDHTGNIATALAGGGLEDCAADLAACRAGACGDGSVAGGEQCDGANLNGATCSLLGFAGGGTLGCTASCSYDLHNCSMGAFRRVFITSQLKTGAFGGAAAADAFCQERADAALLGGTWTAWVSDSTTNARARITPAEYRRVDNTTIVANSFADLTDGTIDRTIGLTEFGSSTTTDRVWTGTDAGGNVAEGRTCADWGSVNASGGGAIGKVDQTNLNWTYETNSGCNVSRGFYCFEK